MFIALHSGGRLLDNSFYKFTDWDERHNFILKKKEFLVKQNLEKKKNFFFKGIQKIKRILKKKEKKKHALRRSFYRKFKFYKWALVLKIHLRKKNVLANRSMSDKDKFFFLREYIISHLKSYGITTKLLRKRNKIITTEFPYITNYVKKPFVKKQEIEPNSNIHENTRSWSYRKKKLFTITELPKKRKRVKRLKLFWKYKWFIKTYKNRSRRGRAYLKRIRAVIFKKKILLKKIIKYYYSFDYKKPLKGLIKYSIKKKNKTTINATSNLLNVFECHLCIFIFRCKLAISVIDCKRLITGGNILVNGKIIYKPNYILKNSDIVQLNEKSVLGFYYKFILINLPPRWRKSKFFYRLKMNNRVAAKLDSREDSLFYYKHKKELPFFLNFLYRKWGKRGKIPHKSFMSGLYSLYNDRLV